MWWCIWTMNDVQATNIHHGTYKIQHTIGRIWCNISYFIETYSMWIAWFHAIIIETTYNEYRIRFGLDENSIDGGQTVQLPLLLRIFVRLICWCFYYLLSVLEALKTLLSFTSISGPVYSVRSWKQAPVLPVSCDR